MDNLNASTNQLQDKEDTTPIPNENKSFDWTLHSQLEPDEEIFTNFDYEAVFNPNEDDNNDTGEKYLPSDWWNEEHEKRLHPPRKPKRSKSFSALPPQANEITQNYINFNNSLNNESVNSYENIYPISVNYTQKQFKNNIGYMNYNVIKNVVNQFDISDHHLQYKDKKNLYYTNVQGEGAKDMTLKYNSAQRINANKGANPHNIGKNNNNNNNNNNCTINNSVQSQSPFKNCDINLLLSKCKTHQGSIFLQNLVAGWNDNEINDLLIILCPYLIEIMCSHYGNYFIQKIFQRLNLNQRLLIFTIIDKQFYNLCTNKSGTYSIQALIDVIATPKEEQILAELVTPHLLSFFCNENAHHVIQKIILNFPEHKREFLNSFILTHWVELSSNEFASLCLIKFNIMNSNLYIRMEIINILKINFMRWVGNKHASALFIFILERYGVNYCGFIIQEVKNKFVFLSTQQSTADFVSKVLTITNKLNSNIILSLIWCIIQNENIFLQLLQTSPGLDIVKKWALLGCAEQRKIIESKWLSLNIL